MSNFVASFLNPALSDSACSVTACSWDSSPEMEPFSRSACSDCCPLNSSSCFLWAFKRPSILASYDCFCAFSSAKYCFSLAAKSSAMDCFPDDREFNSAWWRSRMSFRAWSWARWVLILSCLISSSLSAKRLRRELISAMATSFESLLVFNMSANFFCSASRSEDRLTIVLSASLAAFVAAYTSKIFQITLITINNI